MENKTVVIVGVTDVQGSTNVPMALSFMKHGYNLIPVNYRTIIQKYGMEYFEQYVLFLAKTHKPNLILFSKCNGVNPELITKCKEYTTTWLWNMDPIQTIEKCPEVLQHARNAHFSSCTSPTIVEWFKNQGVKNCYHILEGFDYDIMGPTEPDEKYKADISFIGSKTAQRDDFFRYLKENNCDVKFYGPDYPEGKVVGTDFAKVCSSSTFMLSINTYEIPNYCSDRILLYGGCGACILHYDPHGSNLVKEFTESEIITFKTKEELVNLIDELKDDTETRRALSINVREKILRNFTWDHSIAKIIGVLNASRSS